jgi:magnesium transporter
MILGNFEQGFMTNPAMALYIPLIGGTGGNVGIQSSAIVVQGLANGSLEVGKATKQVLKEVGVGLLNASMIAGLVFIYNCFRLGATQITTLAVSISLFCVVIFASVFGTFVPLTLEKLKIDPALATGPFISITNDIIGMVIYMCVSAALLNTFGVNF